jgi:N-6 DNA Methylase
MPLSLNEIRTRAIKFGIEWKDETRERAEKDTFWNEFFEVFGLKRRKLAIYEAPAKRFQGRGFIDLFWKGNLIAEHKSAGEDLDSAFLQATDYFNGLKDNEIPKFVIVSNFARIRLYDLDENTQVEIETAKLHEHIELFHFISGYKKHSYVEQEPVNIKASELMGKLHDSLLATGYSGEKLEILLVRIMFILFADDTLIWEKGLFDDFIRLRTNEDGSDLGSQLERIFGILNTPEHERQTNLDESLKTLTYINGGLFANRIPVAEFDSDMRNLLLDCSKFSWSDISPAIFGSLFQYVMNKEKRSNLGAHYTNEPNIMKTIKPLFLDELYFEFEKAKNSRITNKRRADLNILQEKISKLTFLDPACGCGNFLIISYRELRKLELKILQELNNSGGVGLSIEYFSKVNINQFYGIEIEMFSAKIAETAMWLMDHMMNLELSEIFGEYYARLPLTDHATIINENALQTDWNTVIEASKLNYIVGNPPFYGSRKMTDEQKNDLKKVFNNMKGVGDLDYVAGWYKVSCEILELNPEIQVALVSTNSITQGMQVNLLWENLMEQYSIIINFAHRTFQWSSEARGTAAVHCVIIGFAKNSRSIKRLFDYPSVNADPVETNPQNINPYLVDADTMFLQSRTRPICSVPQMNFGNMPADGGSLIFSQEDYDSFISIEPNSKNFIRRFLTAREFLNNQNRYCLWLKDVSPNELRSMPHILEKIKQVKEVRLASSRPHLANTPTLFAQITQPENADFILIPRHSSEKREYIPMAFFDSSYIAGDSCLIIPNATLFHFGVLTSKMHMTWVKYVCGRLESRFRYSKEVVYNNFPWIEPTETEREKISTLAQKVLVARENYPDSSLADLYDPLTMPSDLVQAHNNLNKAVDKLYSSKTFESEAKRMELLFELYNHID